MCDALSLGQDDGAPSPEDELPDGLVVVGFLPGHRDNRRQEALVPAAGRGRDVLGLNAEVEAQACQRGSAGSLKNVIWEFGTNQIEYAKSIGVRTFHNKVQCSI